MCMCDNIIPYNSGKSSWGPIFADGIYNHLQNFQFDFAGACDHAYYMLSRVY